MSQVTRLLEIMARLRNPELGCPWDREQTFESIAPYTIEEAYEVADAIGRNDHRALVDELGDLLFHVVFHSQMAGEAGLFDFEDVVQAIIDKMIRRHPHVFAGAKVKDVHSQSREWEASKAAEREATTTGSTMDRVHAGLPAGLRAYKLQREAARCGFDWHDAAAVLPKLKEELEELEAALAGSGEDADPAAELGDLLFSCINLARHLGIDPEAALRGTNLKFESRFRRMEQLLRDQGGSLEASSLAQLDALWDKAKAEEG